MTNKKNVCLKIILGVSISCSFMFLLCAIVVFIGKLPNNGIWIGLSSVFTILGTIMDYLLFKYSKQDNMYAIELFFILLYRITTICFMLAMGGHIFSPILFFVGYYAAKSFANSIKYYQKSLDCIRKERNIKHIETI